jgi:hypothetical protein
MPIGAAGTPSEASDIAAAIALAIYFFMVSGGVVNDFQLRGLSYY